MPQTSGVRRLPFTVSFEFFPPKSDSGRDSLLEAATALARFQPEFVTVTFGAGGATKSGTFEAALLLQEKTGLKVGAHLSYFGIPKAELFEYADRLWDHNIKHLVALRGDIPADQDISQFKEPEYFEYTSEFVEALLGRHPFDISVGAYPEKHPDAPSLAADIIALKKKCDAGSARAITQFFFSTETYLTFLREVREMDISTPIVPGLLPVRDFEKICLFADKCQARIPADLRDLFSGKDDPAQTGTDLLARQVRELYEAGVTHFHFYTLNKADMILSVLEQFLNQHKKGN